MGFHAVQLQNIRIFYDVPSLPLQIKIKNAEISGLESWNPNDKTNIKFKMSVNGHDIDFSGSSTPFSRSPLIKGNMQIDEFDLAHIQPLLDTFARNPVPSGYYKADAEVTLRLSEKNRVNLNINGDMSLDDFVLRQNDLTLKIPSLKWNGTIGIGSELSGSLTNIETDGKLTAQKINLHQAALQLKNSEILWQGPFSCNLGKDKSLQDVKANSSLRIDVPEFVFNTDTAEFTGGFETDATIKTAQSENKAISTHAKGMYRFKSLQAVLPDMTINQQDITWDGTFASEYEHDRAPHFSGNGIFRAANGNIKLVTPGYILKQKLFQAEGEFSISGKNTDSPVVRAEFQGSAEKISLASSAGRKETAALDSFSFKKFSLTDLHTFKSDTFRLSGLQFPDTKAENNPNNGFSAAVQEIVLQNCLLKKMQHLSIDSVDVREAKINLKRSKDGTFPFVKGYPEESSEKEKQSTGGKKKKFTYGIDTIKVDGDSSFVFHDSSVKPAFTASLSPFSLTLDNYTNKSHDTVSELSLEGKTGRHATLAAEGIISPFADPVAMDLHIDLKEYDLTALSPYTGKNIGYGIESGQLNADITWEITDNNQLDALFDLLLVKPEVRKLGKNTIGGETEGLKISLDRGLDLLRNDRGNVEITVPVSNDINDPAFHFRHIFWQAFGNALQRGAVSYFAPIGVSVLTGTALPAGAFWAASKVFSKLTAFRIDPLYLEPLQKELTHEQKKRIASISELLQERPEVELMICGISAPEDLRMLRGKKNENQPQPSAAEIASPGQEELLQLVDLSTKRSDAVKQYLISEGIESRRLIKCRPQYVPDKDAVPAVEMGI
ncbi:MAG: DUF748 domain-containing protein [Desulfobulbaceae bacterium]|nr:DUF748 domain-containing protein [Desulfobulbaceae bacterium]